MSINKECKSLFKNARALYLAGNYSECADTLDNILNLEPEHYNSLAMKAACFDNLDRIDDAAKLLSQATQLEPSNILGWQVITKHLEFGLV